MADADEGGVNPPSSNIITEGRGGLTPPSSNSNSSSMSMPEFFVLREEYFEGMSWIRIRIQDLDLGSGS